MPTFARFDRSACTEARPCHLYVLNPFAPRNVKLGSGTQALSRIVADPLAPFNQPSLSPALRPVSLPPCRSPCSPPLVTSTRVLRDTSRHELSAGHCSYRLNAFGKHSPALRTGLYLHYGFFPSCREPWHSCALYSSYVSIHRCSQIRFLFAALVSILQHGATPSCQSFTFATLQRRNIFLYG